MSQTGNERWAAIVGLEGFYEVSDHGRVRSLDRTVECAGGFRGAQTRTYKGRILKLQPNRISGHLTVCLPPLHGQPRKSRNNNVTYVHRLVMQGFGEPGAPDALVRHRDDNPFNNHISNLEWGTYADNAADRKRNAPVYSMQALFDRVGELEARLARCVCGC